MQGWDGISVQAQRICRTISAEAAEAASINIDTSTTSALL